MKSLHSFVKFLVDLALVVFLIWVPMFHFNLKDSRYAVLVWMVIFITIGVIIYYLHGKGGHKL